MTIESIMNNNASPAGIAESFGWMFIESYAKYKAAQTIKRLRDNDKACLDTKGRLMDSKTKARLLEQAAFLRKRAAGQAELPQIKVVAI